MSEPTASDSAAPVPSAPSSRRPSTASRLLALLVEEGLATPGALALALQLPLAELEACRQGRAPLALAMQQRLSVFAIQHTPAGSRSARQARALGAQTEAAARMESGATVLHVLVPPRWR